MIFGLFQGVHKKQKLQSMLLDDHTSRLGSAKVTTPLHSLIPGLNARHLRLTAHTLYFMMQNTTCKGDICKRTQIQSSNITSFWRHEMEK
jgi:hypothetical protein